MSITFVELKDVNCLCRHIYETGYSKVAHYVILIEPLYDKLTKYAEDRHAARNLKYALRLRSEEEELSLASLLFRSSRLDQDRQVNTEQQHEEEGAFELLEMIREGDANPNHQDIRFKFLQEHQSQDIDPLEIKKLEDAAFTLLDTIFDDDEPIDDDKLFPAAQLAANQDARGWWCASQLDRASREST